MTPPPPPGARRAPAPSRPRATVALLAAGLLGACGGGGAGEASAPVASGSAVPESAALAPATPALAVGDPAPDVVFVALDGSRPRLRELGRAVLVSFWSTDCRPCAEEAPALEALRARFAPRGFELVSVAMPYDRPDRVLERAGGWPHPVALDVDGATLRAFEPVPGTPTGVLVGPEGTVLARWSGPADVRALAARLDALLPPAPGPDGSAADDRARPAAAG